MQQPNLKQEKEESINPEKLKEALDESSKLNRNLGLSFAAIIFFIAVNIAATTDMDLFLPEGGFSVPFLDLTLGVVDFFLAIPFVILILHYNILFNLDQHSNKLMRWQELNKHSSNELELYPFLFNFAISPLKPLHAIALSVVIRITIFMLPLGLLLFILIRFADYQSWPITIWHYAAVLLDAALIVTHSDRIMEIIRSRKSKSIEAYTAKDFFNFSKAKNHFLRYIKNFGIIIIKSIPALIALLTSVIFLVLATVWNLLTKIKLLQSEWIKKVIRYQVSLFTYLRAEAVIVHLASLYIIFFVFIMTANVESIEPINMSNVNEGIVKSVRVFGNKNIFRSLYNNFTPHLDLREKILVESLPEKDVIQLYLDKAYNENEDQRELKKQEILLEFTKPYILKGRSFRYADFSDATLTKTDFREADLTFAVLRRAQLKKARLSDAKLRGATLSGADLNQADLNQAELQGANLRGSKLKKATLNGAGLQGADLFQAELQEALLMEANLQMAELEDTDLQGAYLALTNLQGSNLSKSQNQGATLQIADLTGTKLWNANLQGAMLSYANLQAAILLNTNLQGAVLSEANLQGAVLSEANLQGAILYKTRFRGADFDKDFPGNLLLIDVTDDIDTSFFNSKFETTINNITGKINNMKYKAHIIDNLNRAKRSYEMDTNSTFQFPSGAKIYKPKDLKSDSSFFIFRRKIAAQNKEVAIGMLWGTYLLLNDHPIYRPLYEDLYQYLQKKHPDYLEEFELDMEETLNKGRMW